MQCFVDGQFIRNCVLPEMSSPTLFGHPKKTMELTSAPEIMDYLSFIYLLFIVVILYFWADSDQTEEWWERVWTFL